MQDWWQWWVSDYSILLPAASTVLFPALVLPQQKEFMIVNCFVARNRLRTAKVAHVDSEESPTKPGWRRQALRRICQAHGCLEGARLESSCSPCRSHLPCPNGEATGYRPRGGAERDRSQPTTTRTTGAQGLSLATQAPSQFCRSAAQRSMGGHCRYRPGSGLSTPVTAHDGTLWC